MFFNLSRDLSRPRGHEARNWAVDSRGLAVVLSALMIMIPMGLGEAFAQSAPRVGDGDQQVAEVQPLSPGSWISW